MSIKTKTQKEKQYAYMKKWLKTPVGRFHKYKDTAKYRGHEFELDCDDFNLLLNENCHYCNSKKSNGIDRVDSNIGYIKGNVLPCCKKCNFMKNTHSYNDFLKHISIIYKNLSKD